MDKYIISASLDLGMGPKIFLKFGPISETKEGIPLYLSFTDELK